MGTLPIELPRLALARFERRCAGEAMERRVAGVEPGAGGEVTDGVGVWTAVLLGLGVGLEGAACGRGVVVGVANADHAQIDEDWWPEL